jgi:hypothetical protein
VNRGGREAFQAEGAAWKPGKPVCLWRGPGARPEGASAPKDAGLTLGEVGTTAEFEQRRERGELILSWVSLAVLGGGRAEAKTPMG